MRLFAMALRAIIGSPARPWFQLQIDECAQRYADAVKTDYSDYFGNGPQPQPGSEADLPPIVRDRYEWPDFVSPLRKTVRDLNSEDFQLQHRCPNCARFHSQDSYGCTDG